MPYHTVHLRCEYRVDPLAIDAAAPRLSWEGLCSRTGAQQSAYRILAASSLEKLRTHTGDLWDTGKVASNASFQIPYGGKCLASYQQVFWKVMAWDEHHRPGSWSKAATWTMGILDPKEWKAEWIGNYLGNASACPLLRREFTPKGKVRRALFHATAQGLYHLTLNGKEVTCDCFTPGWTDYRKRRYYQCYDLTRMLKKESANCIGIELAEGWYKGNFGLEGHSLHYGNRTALLAQLRIEYENGKVETIHSDAQWKSAFGPTLMSSIYHGETVDAQLAMKGWNHPGYDDSAWSQALPQAAAFQVPKGHKPFVLQAYPAEPVRRTQELRPIKYWSVAPGKIIYDFGQNFSGRVRLSCKGKAGAVVRMRFGEMVNLDNTLYVENLRCALATDTYVMKGQAHEVWEPKFTFHGFRYVEVSGLPVLPNLNNVTGIVIGSDTSRTGNFECSLPLINKIYQNAVWTQRSNFLDVPTDCPQRDERLGWTGDAQVFIRTAICNMDVAAFFTKWMNDLTDAQYDDGAFPYVAPNILDGVIPSKADAAWGDAGVICPWTLYQCYEDRTLLEKVYPNMKKWIAFLKKTSRDFLRHPDWTPAYCFGDWLSIDADTPKDVVMTAHFAYAADITRKVAETLGKTADAKSYASLFANICKAFNKAFVQKNGKISGDTQTAYLMALKFNLLDEKIAALAAKHLSADIRKKKHLSTGFIGTGLIMSVLRDTGNLNQAYTLLENTTFPSWGYSVVNGATTIWERWNGWTKEHGPGDVNMNSYSHYAYGAVSEWMFDTITGIDHGACGFQEFVLRPQPGGSLQHATATYHSPYGLIRSAWRKNSRGYCYECSIPANTHATVTLPVKTLKHVILNGTTISQQDVELTDTTSVRLPAGEYTFAW